MRGSDLIGVLSFNKPGLTSRCLDSVLASGYDPGQVCLLHNGSDRKTIEILSGAYPGIRHRILNENRGYSGGFNALMKWAFDSGARSVLFLTNDTLIDPKTLSHCLGTEKVTDSGLIAPSVYYLKYPDKLDSSGGYFDRKRFTLSHYHERPRSILLEPFLDYIPGTALWMRKDIFMSTGGMDETFHTYWEDADLSFRCHRKGIRMARSIDAAVRHGIGQTCHKKPLYTTYFFQRNRLIFCQRYLEGAEKDDAVSRIREEIGEMRKRSAGRNFHKKETLFRDLEKLFQ